MTKDEIILAQQARIEQLRETLQPFALIDLGRDSVPSTFGMDVLASRKALSTPDDLYALRAHDAAILREAAEYCKQQADEWDSDRVLTFKNYAGNCADELNTRAEAIEKGGV